MIKQTTKQISEILNATLIGNGETVIENISTDTRQAVSSGLFFALKGEKFDAHDYVENAIEQGCVALVVERELAVNVPQIMVADTRLALGQLAKWLREKINPLTVAMTGSSGKTTVKEMTASILQKSADDFEKVLFTAGNFNNDIGVPLTLLGLTPTHQFAVIELGANHQGEIAYTTALAQPNVALVNNVAAAHLEGFGSLTGVAQAKGEIYRGLAKNGIAIINKAHDYAELWATEIGDRKVQFFAYQDPSADFYASNIELNETGSRFQLHTPQGDIEICLPYLGKHNIENALAATALAVNAGATLSQVKQGLEIRSQVKGRLFPISVSENLLLLDDTYNANVDSLCSAIAVLQQQDAFRILVVGDMAELGEQSAACHQQVADFAQRSNLDVILSYGSESAVISQRNSGKHFNDKMALSTYLIDIIQQKLKQNQKVVVLLKGSRRMKMEEIIQYLRENFVC